MQFKLHASRLLQHLVKMSSHGSIIVSRIADHLVPWPELGVKGWVELDSGSRWHDLWLLLRKCWATPKKPLSFPKKPLSFLSIVDTNISQSFAGSLQDRPVTLIIMCPGSSYQKMSLMWLLLCSLVMSSILGLSDSMLEHQPGEWLCREAWMRRGWKSFCFRWFLHLMTAPATSSWKMKVRAWCLRHTSRSWSHLFMSP